MKCMLCGTDNKNEARNCKGCGALLGQRETSISGRGLARTVVEAETPAMSAGNKTRIVSSDELDGIVSSEQNFSEAPDTKKTRYVPPEAVSHGSAKMSTNVAPLAGFLVTFSWDASGLWFPVREGRTTVGTDTVCDAVLKHDRAMSGKHFAIMIRKGAIRIRDLETTNATVVDGKEVWSDSCSGGHGSKISAGDTEFTLVMIPSRETINGNALADDIEDEE